jgi:hypothetical protein
MNDLPARHSFLRQCLVVALVVPLMSLACPPSARAQQAPAPASQTTDVGGVTVRVKPKPLEAGAHELVFGVSLDTHSQPLDDNLGETTVLVVDGTALKPARVSGSGPGGHHRDVVLSFDMPSVDFKSVELRIQRAGESSPRTFRWDGAAWR